MDLSTLDIALLALTGAWAAAINAVAGGGTFFTFPMLIFVGLPPTLANTTNKIGIWFGSMASVGGYWSEIKEHKGQLVLLCVLGAIGSVGGSLLLLITPAETFSSLVPWLMLIATTLFAFGRYGLAWIRARLPEKPAVSFFGKIMQWLGQTIIGIYGGFFGAGLGILLMALYELMGIKSVHEMNGLKVLVATAVNIMSVITFIIAGAIIWPAAIALTLGAVAGGYWGAVFTKHLPQLWVKRFIILYGFAVSIWFFIK